ncbi:MAG: hypothetical protein M1812_001299 [Candelaria pacifica]|nr:MAG: hypothetical protein M1812_001299 [Candelaria pacifica]
MRVSHQSLYLLSASILHESTYARFTKRNLAGSTPVEVGFVSSDSLPAPELKIDLSTEHWEGKSWHYNTPSGAFSVAIIDHGSMEPSSRYIRQRDDNTTSVVPSDEDRGVVGFLCDYVYGCVNAVTLGAAVSIDTMSAAKRALADRIHANNNELGKRLIDGIVVSFSVSIVSGIAQYYITNAIQKDAGKSLADNCSPATDTVTEVKQMVAKLQTDIDALGKVIMSGSRYQALTYDHYSENRFQQMEGKHMRHAVKVTKDPHDQNPLEC